MIDTMKKTWIVTLLMLVSLANAQTPVSEMLQEISTATSAERIEKDIRKLVDFGTRHTLSDTVSEERGIGAARRWIQWGREPGYLSL